MALADELRKEADRIIKFVNELHEYPIRTYAEGFHTADLLRKAAARIEHYQENVV